MIAEQAATGDSSILIGAIVTALTAFAGWLTWLRSGKAESRGKDTAQSASIGEEWQRLTAGMREQIDDQGRQIATLRASDDRNRREITQLRVQNAEHTDQIAALHAENTGQARQIGRLEKALAAARTYITQLIALLRAHNIEPPDPPADYTE